MLRTQLTAAAIMPTGDLCQSLAPLAHPSVELSGRQSFYPKVVQLFARSELRPQPARSFAAAGPSLRGVVRISILRKNLWVRATRVPELIIGGAKFMQALVKFAFLRCYLAAQFANHLFMKVPQLIHGHGF
jgi:hypothetical protein